LSALSITISQSLAPPEFRLFLTRSLMLALSSVIPDIPSKVPISRYAISNVSRLIAGTQRTKSLECFVIIRYASSRTNAVLPPPPSPQIDIRRCVFDGQSCSWRVWRWFSRPTKNSFRENGSSLEAAHCKLNSSQHRKHKGKKKHTRYPLCICYI